VRLVQLDISLAHYAHARSKRLT